MENDQISSALFKYIQIRNKSLRRKMQIKPTLYFTKATHSKQEEKQSYKNINNDAQSFKTIFFVMKFFSLS